MVYYRKYRPQTIAQLDNPKLQETLKAVLSQKDIPHAFLFTGPKGLGKTSTARIIAKVLNCTSNKRDGIEPCNTCDQCTSITNGTNIDVLEIDGASNRGIDEIRDLRERVKLAPSAAKKKVYIIDEVHMLTTEAFNALLKTIEEPPSHVVFIFCTTEPHKVPATIISRCFHISLQKATKEELVHALIRIKENEKISVDPDALDLIAEMGDGGYRDATKIFEELVALAQGQKIDKSFIENHYKITGISLDVEDFLRSLYSRNAVDALRKIGVVADQGMSIKYFIEQVLLEFHTMLLSKMGIEKNSPKLPEFSLEEIAALTTLLSEAYQQTKNAVIPQLPLEMAVILFVENSTNGGTVTSEDNSVPESNQAPRHTGTPTIHSLLKRQQVQKVEAILHPKKEEPKPARTDPSVVQPTIDTNRQGNSGLLENLIYKVKSVNATLAGVLRGCKVTEITKDTVTLEAGYTFHKERLEERKSYEIIERMVKEITGKPLKVQIVLKK